MLKKIIAKLVQMPENRFHPLVYIGGEPRIGKNVFIGLFSEVNAKGAIVEIGDNCDIASFVSINVADSHKKTIGLMNVIERKNIVLENNVFVGSHSFIGGGVEIGHHSVVAAGTIIAKPCKIPPYSLIIGNPFVIKEGYYKNK
jgi:acetyltransferase-like isoleucine patch superfamily enzyme